LDDHWPALPGETQIRSKALFPVRDNFCVAGNVYGVPRNGERIRFGTGRFTQRGLNPLFKPRQILRIQNL
jgi:hypothetical protein